MLLTNGYVAPKFGALKDVQVLSDELKAAIYRAEFNGDMWIWIMLVMYNCYQNSAAIQLRRINDNGRLDVLVKYFYNRLGAVAEQCVSTFKSNKDLQKYLKVYKNAQRQYK